jgi:hypothetical protein
VLPLSSFIFLCRYSGAGSHPRLTFQIMTSPGNHEAESGESFVQYNARHPMPYRVRLCVCVCVCVYVCLCVSLSLFVYACVHMCACICVYVCGRPLLSDSSLSCLTPAHSRRAAPPTTRIGRETSRTFMWYAYLSLSIVIEPRIQKHISG